jgi:hypothetical protein
MTGDTGMTGNTGITGITGMTGMTGPTGPRTGAPLFRAYQATSRDAITGFISWSNILSLGVDIENNSIITIKADNGGNFNTHINFATQASNVKFTLLCRPAGETSFSAVLPSADVGQVMYCINMFNAGDSLCVSTTANISYDVYKAWFSLHGI